MATKRELLRLLETTEKTRLKMLRDESQAQTQPLSERADALKSEYTAKVLGEIGATIKKLGGSIPDRISVRFGSDGYAGVAIRVASVPGLSEILESINKINNDARKSIDSITKTATKLRQDLTLYGAIPSVVKELERFFK